MEQQPLNRRWPLSRRNTLLLAGGVILLVIIVVVVAVLIGGKSTDDTPTANVYHDRPGYDRGKLGDGVADPFAVSFTANTTPVSYKGNKVIQACNVLTIDDITKQGMLLKANTLPTPISRIFNDGVGKAAYTDQVYGSSLSGGSLGRDINNCHYVMEAADGVPSINVSVFQPFAIPASVVTEEIKDHYTPSGTAEGMEVYKRSSGTSPGQNAAEYIVRKGDTGGFSLTLELDPKDTSKASALLETAAKNFIQQQKSPAGPGNLKYDSPVYPKSIVRACDLITNDAVAALGGRDASPLANEGIPTSVAILKFNSQGNQTPYPYIANECTRGTAGGGSGLGSDGPGDLDLTVETRSFLDAEPAKLSVEMQSQKNPNNRENMPLPDQIGDGSIAYTDVSNGKHIVFYKGRIVIDIQLDQFAQRITGTTSLSAAAEKLAPIAKSMVDKIKANE